MDSDGSNVIQLTDDASTHRSPAFSPDGSQIAFWSNRDGVTTIYVMNADGSNIRQLTSGGTNMDPSWSPDGTRIVFISNRDIPSTYFVYTMDPDGGNVSNLGAVAQSFQSRPVFSPDGQKIAFASRPLGDLGHISIMNADGTDVENLTPSPSIGQYPVWSPDGKTIAFQGTPDLATQPFRVYLIDLETRQFTRLTEFSAEPHAWAWFPAGGGFATEGLQSCSCWGQVPWTPEGLVF